MNLLQRNYFMERGLGNKKLTVSDGRLPGPPAGCNTLRMRRELVSVVGAAVLAFLASSCATQPRVGGMDPSTGSNVTGEVVADAPGLAAALSVDIKEADSKLEKVAADIPIEMNGMVQKWIEYFTIKDRDRFERYLMRAAYYRSMVHRVLRRSGVPTEISELALIESGYQVDAKSHASAVGVWQFMAATGHRYGLKSGPLHDERRDPIRATEAAAKYLSDLHNVFHNWYLAIAAYNAGEQRILNAIFRGKSRDFWTLVRRNALPRETMDYVPKFLAAVIILRKPERFGFKIQSIVEHPDVELVRVPSPVRLAELAHRSGLESSQIAALNPHLKHGITPPEVTQYDVWVPAAKRAIVAQAAPGLTRLTLKMRQFDAPTRVAKWQRGLGRDQLKYSRSSVKHARYRVKQGDSLTSIASRFGVSVTHIKRLNRIRHGRIFAGQTLRIHDTGRI